MNIMLNETAYMPIVAPDLVTIDRKRYPVEGVRTWMN